MANDIKPFLVKAPEQKEFKQIDAWTYPARCYWIIDLWTRREFFKKDNKEADIHKIRFLFEFPTEVAVFKDELWEQPFALSKDYTFSFADSGNLKKMVESWIWRKFTDEEKEIGFNITSLIGLTCQITVIKRESGNGKIYSEIQTITPIMKDKKWNDMITVDDQVNPSIWINLSDEELSLEDLEKLPNFHLEKIKTSYEYNSRFWM